MIPDQETQPYKRYQNGSTGDFWPRLSPSPSYTEWFRKNKQYVLAPVVVVAVTCLCLGLLTNTTTTTTTTTATGFIIAGGYNGSVQSSAEVFNPMTGHSCRAGNLSQTRQDAPMCHNIICGGWGSPDPDRSCERFDGASSFARLSVRLMQRRDDHLCWGLKSGEVILFGGLESKRTTERVSADGLSSSRDFNLPYDISYSCGIDLGDSFIVTGGYEDRVTVAQFSQTGFVKYLGNLNQGRRGHACSKFVDDSGKTALLVTGGYLSDSTILSSTELYLESTSTWSYAASLPSARSGISAATLDNSIFIFGGKLESSVYSKEIVSYDPSSDSWKVVGEMIQQRSFYGVSNLAEVSEVCP